MRFVTILVGWVVLGSLGGEVKEKKMEKLEKATFAGGCFWCMEPPYEGLEGVKSVTAGYMGGKTVNPTYEEVSSGKTGHAEVVEVVFDPTKISYEQLLDVFWRNIDPTAENRQFADVGSQYRTAIFYHSEAQKEQAERSKAQLAKSGKFKDPIVTAIVPAGPFYPAEEYHQDYYKKNPQHYERYKVGSGRAGFLKRVWGASQVALESSPKDWKKVSEAEWKKRLTPEQFKVLRQKGTEPAFTGAYHDTKVPGTYRCAGCGVALFTSEHKFDSGTGWPSFWDTVAPGRVERREDRGGFTTRIEVVCARCGGHLGHVFEDGPPPTGLRYCINSAALTLEKK